MPPADAGPREEDDFLPGLEHQKPRRFAVV
jgi:hypothetical protein